MDRLIRELHREVLAMLEDLAALSNGKDELACHIASWEAYWTEWLQEKEKEGRGDGDEDGDEDEDRDHPDNGAGRGGQLDR